MSMMLMLDSARVVAIFATMPTSSLPMTVTMISFRFFSIRYGSVVRIAFRLSIVITPGRDLRGIFPIAHGLFRPKSVFRLRVTIL